MTVLLNDPTLKDTGRVTEESSSDYEMTFTEYWWKFECKTCGETIYHSTSMSVIGKGTKIKCGSCKSQFSLKETYVAGKEKKP